MQRDQHRYDLVEKYRHNKDDRKFPPVKEKTVTQGDTYPTDLKTETDEYSTSEIDTVWSDDSYEKRVFYDKNMYTKFAGFDTLDDFLDYYRY